jgi:uncharacterized protein
MDISIPGLPGALTWSSAPTGITHTGSGGVVIEAGPRTDVFIDPQTAEPTLTAPRALAPAPDGDFQLSARVEVAFGSTFDAGVLVVWYDDEHTAKLCFELSPIGEPTVVSVVTRGVSDDANGWPVTGGSVWLRISRIDAMWAMHASSDGVTWAFGTRLPARIRPAGPDRRARAVPAGRRVHRHV